MKFNLTNGKDLFDAKSYLVKLRDKKALIEIKEVKESRSLKQNAYLHLLLQIFGSHFGWNLTESKILYKREVAPSIYVYFRNGKPFIKSSTELTTKEMSDSVELLKKYSSENGLELPDAEDSNAIAHWEEEIKKSSRYL